MGTETPMGMTPAWHAEHRGGQDGNVGVREAAVNVGHHLSHTFLGGLQMKRHATRYLLEC